MFGCLWGQSAASSCLPGVVSEEGGIWQIGQWKQSRFGQDLSCLGLAWTCYTCFFMFSNMDWNIHRFLSCFGSYWILKYFQILLFVVSCQPWRDGCLLNNSSRKGSLLVLCLTFEWLQFCLKVVDLVPRDSNRKIAINSSNFSVNWKNTIIHYYSTYIYIHIYI